MKVRRRLNAALPSGARSKLNRSVRPLSPCTNGWRAGGKLILFGNGGSATDCNDWALDCVMPPAGYRPIPAVSLSLEPANITAIANDVGTEVIFLRQLIAQARPEDIAVGISTSGGSRNIIMALEEARKREPFDRRTVGVRRRRDPAAWTGRLSYRRTVRLHPAHSGSAGLDLSHHSRNAGGIETWPSLSSLAQPAVLIPRICGSGWSGTRSEFVEYDVEADPRRVDRMRDLSAANAPYPCWWKTEKSFKLDGRGAVAL